MMKMSEFKPEVVEALQQPINPSRVSKDGKGFSHVEAWDVRRTMNKIFGFGNWSMDTGQMQLLFESESENLKQPGKLRWSVGYKAQVTLHVGRATYTEWAAGDAINPVRGDAHDMAIKTAESQAFKRCAVNLGDQFGLSLYNNGSFAATVGDVVGQEHADDSQLEPLIQALMDVTETGKLVELGNMIKSLDLSDKVKETLRLSFLGAKDSIASKEQI
jgi:recombination DNA repair RAD52 pathway protein